jgi:hypothetical protein
VKVIIKIDKQRGGNEMNLYELTQEFVQFKNQLEEMDLDDQTVADTLDSLYLPIEVKAENIIKHIKNLEALADAKKLEAKRLSDSASADLKRVEKLKTYLADNLQRVGIKNLQAGVFALSFRKGSEVVEVDENKVPNQYTRPDLWIAQEPKLLGKAELKKMLKSDDPIPGITLVRKPDSLVVK